MKTLKLIEQQCEYTSFISCIQLIKSGLFSSQISLRTIVSEFDGKPNKYTQVQLSYSECVRAKATNRNIKLKGFLNYPKVDRLYTTSLELNNSRLFEIYDKFFTTVYYISGTIKKFDKELLFNKQNRCCLIRQDDLNNDDIYFIFVRSSELKEKTPDYMLIREIRKWFNKRNKNDKVQIFWS